MNIPDTWASFEIDSLINEESSKLKRTREIISERFGLNHNKMVREDLNYVAMPEILSAQYCILSGNKHLLAISPPLQAFLAYALSIYDIISDDHLYKNGKPTFLETYGRDFLLLVEGQYKKVIKELSRELEKEISGAIKITENMYYHTIKWDKVRNSGLYGADKSILLQDKLVGKHAYNLAVLSNAKELATFSSHLVNAMTTLEDLIDLFCGEDFTGKKTTIPMSFLADEFGWIVEDFNIIKESLAIKKIKEYINNKINCSREIISKYTSKDKNLLLKIIENLDNFNRDFPEEYL